MAEVNLLPPVLDSSNFAPPSASFTESERERRQSNSAFSGEARPAFDPEKAFGDSGRRGSRSASDASSTGGAGREELKKANQGKEGLGGMVEEEEDEPSKGTDAATSEPAEPTPTPSSNPSAALDEAMPSTPPLAIKVKRDVNSTQMALTPGLDDTPFKFGDK